MVEIRGHLCDHVSEDEKIKRIEGPAKESSEKCQRSLSALGSRFAHRDGGPAGRNLGFTIASETRAACAISQTSWTRTMCAPPRMLAATVAAVPKRRPASGWPPSVFPMKPFREAPNNS